jgi:hypothetical protein
VVIARRSGRRWFVAGMNADAAPATLQLDLGFLGTRRGWITSDGDTPRALVRRAWRGGSGVSVTMAARGGFLAELA